MEARRAGLAVLADAVEAFAAQPGWPELQRACEALPLAASVDVVLVRAREDGRSRRFHLVAATGLSAREHGRLAFAALTLPQERALQASEHQSSLARELGLRWAAGSWLRDGEPVGTLFVGCRTRRHPEPGEVSVVRRAGADLAPGIASLDRSPAALRRRSSALARQAGAGWGRREPLAKLRSREVEILELYADGLGTAEIADLLVISPHTVRTHVRNALRRLGAHSRHEAVERLLRWQLREIVPGANGARR